MKSNCALLCSIPKLAADIRIARLNDIVRMSKLVLVTSGKYHMFGHQMPNKCMVGGCLAAMVGCQQKINRRST